MDLASARPPGSFDTQAKVLKEIGCTADGARYVIATLTPNLDERFDGNRPQEVEVADAFLDEAKCPGARGLSEENKAKLASDTRSGPSCVARSRHRGAIIIARNHRFNPTTTKPGRCTLKCRQRGGPTGLLRRGGGPGVAEGRDHLLREAVEVCELDVERGAERGRANDAVEAGIALLDRLQLLDDVLGRPARKPPAFTASSIVGNLTYRPAAGRASPRSARRSMPARGAIRRTFSCSLRNAAQPRGSPLRSSRRCGVAERQPLAEFEAGAAPRQVFRKSCFGPGTTSQPPHRLQRVCSPA